MDEMEIRAIRETILGEQLIVELDQVIVFGVDDPDTAAGGHQLHQTSDTSKVHLVRSSRRPRWKNVTGEDFEAGEPSLDELGNLIQRDQRCCADEIDVEGVVDNRVTLPAVHTL